MRVFDEWAKKKKTQNSRREAEIKLAPRDPLKIQSRPNGNLQVARKGPPQTTFTFQLAIQQLQFHTSLQSSLGYITSAMDTPSTPEPHPSAIRYILGFLLIGIAWGFTTPFIRAAARTHSPPPHPILDSPSVKNSWLKSKIYGAFFGVVDLLRNPRYAIPLVINLTGSVWFFLLIGKAGEAISFNNLFSSSQSNLDISMSVSMWVEAMANGGHLVGVAPDVERIPWADVQG